MQLIALLGAHWGTVLAVCAALAAVVGAVAKSTSWAFARWREYQAEKRIEHDHRTDSLWGAIKAKDVHLEEERVRAERLQRDLETLRDLHRAAAEKNAELRALTEAQSVSRYALAEKLAVLLGAASNTLSSSIELIDDFKKERAALISSVRLAIFRESGADPEKLREYEEQGHGPDQYRHAALALTMLKTLDLQAQTHATIMAANASFAVRVATFLRDSSLTGPTLIKETNAMREEHTAAVGRLVHWSEHPPKSSQMTSVAGAVDETRSGAGRKRRLAVSAPCG